MTEKTFSEINDALKRADNDLRIETIRRLCDSVVEFGDKDSLVKSLEAKIKELRSV